MKTPTTPPRRSPTDDAPEARSGPGAPHGGHPPGTLSEPLREPLTTRRGRCLTDARGGAP